MNGEAGQLSATRSETTARSHYDSATIWFHWITAILVVMLWGMGQTSSFLPRGPVRHNFWSAHIVLGTILLLVMGARLFWRARGGRVLPSGGRWPLDLLAKVTHWALYILLIAAVVLGVANTWARGWDLFGLISIPAYDASEAKRALVRTINGWHELAANSIMILASFHALAALLQHYVLRNGVLTRMTVNARN